MTKHDFIVWCRESKADRPQCAAVVRALKAYKNEFLFEPQENWPETEFMRRSIERWAADEMIERIKASPDVSPMVTAERFLDEVQGAMRISDSKERARFYMIANNSVGELMDYIHCTI